MKETEKSFNDVEPQTRRESFNLTSFLAKHFEAIATLELCLFIAIFSAILCKAQ